jgi:predicted amidohydrolase
MTTTLNLSTDNPSTLKISVYQGRCTDDVEQNLNRVYQIIDEAGAGGSDFLCLPETYLSNYKRELAMRLDDERVQALIAYTARYDTVVIVGLSELEEKQEREYVYNTALVLCQGRQLGKYRKTMLTGYDRKTFDADYELPIFEAKGIPFGVIICHDSSFIEPALTMRWKGARLLFTPHYNMIPYEQMDEHRTLVRNNHVGLSVLLQMVVARANNVGWNEEQLGYGDSLIMSPLGVPVAAAPLFKETLISAEFDRSFFQEESWRRRQEVPLEVCQQLWEVSRQVAEPRNVRQPVEN